MYIITKHITVAMALIAVNLKNLSNKVEGVFD